MTSHVSKISGDGQVVIPADARARWRADRVIVLDLGDRVVIRPLPQDSVGELVGKYSGRGPTSERARQTARAEEVEHERRPHLLDLCRDEGDETPSS